MTKYAVAWYTEIEAESAQEAAQITDSYLGTLYRRANPKRDYEVIDLELDPCESETIEVTNET